MGVFSPKEKIKSMSKNIKVLEKCGQPWDPGIWDEEKLPISNAVRKKETTEEMTKALPSSKVIPRCSWHEVTKGVTQTLLISACGTQVQVPRSTDKGLPEAEWPSKHLRVERWLSLFTRPFPRCFWGPLCNPSSSLCLWSANITREHNQCGQGVGDLRGRCQQWGHTWHQVL